MGIQALLNRRLQDTAVYWGSPTFGNDGSPSFGAPVEIACFWDDKVILFRDDQGRETASKSVVHVLQDLDEHGMLFHGTLDDLDSAQEDDPRNITNAFEIKQFLKTPSLVVQSEYNRRAIL